MLLHAPLAHEVAKIRMTYGSHDAIVIAETLRKLFIDTKILTKSLTSPQIPMKYLQKVLISEAVVKLIQEDNRGITIENAREIMLESVGFGEYVHSCENQEI